MFEVIFLQFLPCFIDIRLRVIKLRNFMRLNWYDWYISPAAKRFNNAIFLNFLIVKLAFIVLRLLRQINSIIFFCILINRIALGHRWALKYWFSAWYLIEFISLNHIIWLLDHISMNLLLFKTIFTK